MAEIWTKLRDSGGLDGLRHRAGAFRVNGREFLLAALGENADEIDRRVGVAQRGRHRRRVAQIGLHRHNLPRTAQRLQEEGEIGPAARDAHAPAVARQSPHNVTPNEPRAAKHRHQPLSSHALRRHLPPRCRPKPAFPRRRENLKRASSAFCSRRECGNKRIRRRPALTHGRGVHTVRHPRPRADWPNVPLRVRPRLIVRFSRRTP